MILCIYKTISYFPVTFGREIVKGVKSFDTFKRSLKR